MKWVCEFAHLKSAESQNNHIESNLTERLKTGMVGNSEVWDKRRIEVPLALVTRAESLPTFRAVAGVQPWKPTGMQCGTGSLPQPVHSPHPRSLAGISGPLPGDGGRGPIV